MLLRKRERHNRQDQSCKNEFHPDPPLERHIILPLLRLPKTFYPRSATMGPDELLAAHSHRTFPLPNTRWSIRQEWHDLLFAHWPVPVDLLRQKVPAQLELDLWHGD